MKKKRSLDELTRAENNLNFITSNDKEYVEACICLKEIKSVRRKLLSNKKLSNNDINILEEIKIYNKDSDINNFELHPDSLTF